MSDHDMHQIRMNAGAKSMEAIEAIDEEFVDVIEELAPLVSRAIRILLDQGVPKPSVTGLIVGIAVAAIEDETP